MRQRAHTGVRSRFPHRSGPPVVDSVVPSRVSPSSLQEKGKGKIKQDHSRAPGISCRFERAGAVIQRLRAPRKPNMWADTGVHETGWATSTKTIAEIQWKHHGNIVEIVEIMETYSGGRGNPVDNPIIYVEIYMTVIS